MNDTQMMVLELGGKGYSCAQIILAGGLRLMGRENTDLLRSMAGLAQGVGCSGGICGALAGGVCLIALHTGKGHDDETALENGPILMNELVEWFRQEKCGGGDITCDAILGGGPAYGKEDASCRTMEPVLCGGLVAAVWDKALSLLIENGVDPSQGRQEP